MDAFVSNHVMKIDMKGRVSIPASFRAVLARDGFEGLYCLPTPESNAIDAGGYRLIAKLQEKLDLFEETSLEHDLLTTAFYGQSEILKVDQDGRIVLTESLKAMAGIDGHVTFVGKGHRFQLWQPDRFTAFLNEARRKALEVLRKPGMDGAREEVE